MPLPLEAVGARRERRRHAVLLVGLVQRVAADPGAPAAVDALHERILDAGAARRRRRRCGRRPPRSRPGRRPRARRSTSACCPASRSRCRGATGRSSVRTSAGPLHRHRAEARLVQRRHRRELLAVVRAGDDRRGAPFGRRAFAAPVGDHEGAVCVERRARASRSRSPVPLPGASTATTAGALPGRGKPATSRFLTVARGRAGAPSRPRLNSGPSCSRTGRRAARNRRGCCAPRRC